LWFSVGLGSLCSLTCVP